MAKVSKAERNREIVLRRQRGYSYREIASAFGISPQRVGQIVARETRGRKR